MKSFCFKTIKHALHRLGLDVFGTFHFILRSFGDSLTLRLELTGMKCFKRASPGELGQSPIKGERDHKARGPRGAAKSKHIFLAGRQLCRTFSVCFYYIRERNYCSFDMQSQLIATTEVDDFLLLPKISLPEESFYASS